MPMAASQQRVTLVTGASSGIGRACAELLAGQDYGVIARESRNDILVNNAGVSIAWAV